MIKNKLKFSLSLSLLTASMLANPVFAQDLGVPGGSIPYPAQGSPNMIGLFRNNQVGDIIKTSLPFIFIFSGLGMLFYLILGGFQLMTSAGDPKAIKEAQGKITNALIGFFVVFASYWIAQILQVVFHISIVSP